MIKCNTQANDMATTVNNWQTPGASNPGGYKPRVAPSKPAKALPKMRMEILTVSG